MIKVIIVGTILTITVFGFVYIFASYDGLESFVDSDKTPAMNEDMTKFDNTDQSIKKTEILDNSDLSSKLSGIGYSSYRAGQSPINGPHPNLDEIENDIQFLSSITDRIRIYGLEGNNYFIPEIAKKYDLQVAVTLLLKGDDIDQEIIDRGITLANKHQDTIYTMIVENEGLYRKTLSEEQIIDYIIEIRGKLNPDCTITISEPSFIWLEHPKIAQYVDYVMIHNYPYWRGVDIESATNSVIDTYYATRDTLESHVVIGETGWPSDGRNVNDAVPSLENQRKFVKEFIEIADIQSIDYFIFEAFDEKWKPEEDFDLGGSNDAENHWGLFYENGTLKESLIGVIPSSKYDATRN